LELSWHCDVRAFSEFSFTQLSELAIDKRDEFSLNGWNFTEAILNYHVIFLKN